jgi:phosphopantothenate synthetase
MSARGYQFDVMIVDALIRDCPSIERLLQEMSAAHSRREGAAALAAFDLAVIPRRCLGAFQRHVTDILNELAD